MKMFKVVRSSRLLLALAFALVAPPVLACDVCAVYTTVDLGPSRSGFRLGLGEQYTYFGERRLNSVPVPSEGERLGSSITQIQLGYGFGPDWGIDLNIPIIRRSYRRLEDDVLVPGTISGIGDMSLLGTWVPLRPVVDEGLFRLTLFAGLEFPTGNSDPLAEESEEDDDHPDLPIGFGRVSSRGMGTVQHASSPSAIHGHDLALGSGSWDGIIGAHMFGSWEKFYASGLVQYSIRSEGSFDYQYANDLIFQVGPGYFLLLEDEYTLGIQGLVSGDTKGQDSLDGKPLDDTSATYLFAGPAVRLSWGADFTAEVSADIPFVRNETSLQIVPDYRIRGGLIWRF
jgi:hypothetical protein